MSRMIRWISPNWRKLHAALLFLAFYILAPKGGLYAQDSVSGDNKVEDNKVVPIGKAPNVVNFTFGRSINPTGSMFQFGPSIVDAAGVFMNESKSVTLFSVTQALSSYNIGATHDKGAGIDVKNWFFNLDCFENSIHDTGTGPTKKKSRLIGNGLINVLPFNTTIEFDLGIVKPTLTASIDLSVKVKQRVNIDWNVDYPDNGVTMTGSITSDTEKSDVGIETNVVSISVAGASAGIKVGAKVDFKISESTYKIDAKPTFLQLKGTASSDITALEGTFSGDIAGELSFLKAKARLVLFDFSAPPLGLPPQSKVLYNR